MTPMKSFRQADRSGSRKTVWWDGNIECVWKQTCKKKKSCKSRSVHGKHQHSFFQHSANI